jgi:hypothetical protein
VKSKLKLRFVRGKKFAGSLVKVDKSFEVRSAFKASFCWLKCFSLEVAVEFLKENDFRVQ